MPKFITIGYGDEAGYNRTPPSARDAAHAHDEELKREGAVMGIAGLPVQVRNPAANSTTAKEGAFLSAGLPLAGFAGIEAADFAEKDFRLPLRRGSRRRRSVAADPALSHAQ
ncbi:MAG TPA: hypothetical protein VGN68_18525 [Sphingopyxis sp.]|jgi:hypothetical protein|uniref:hypothetical protein n=1 Tax=Sphingopyxis sp. TaxID=1908224 RepID=UPI002E0EDD0C|nr:hypothetical protein [Sphingopyxis sp.]